jgi:SET domain-containing protein
MDVSIKDINEHEWRTFKAESIKHGLKVGEFFNKIVQEHDEKCNEGNWDKVLFGEKTIKGILTQKDVKEIRAASRKSFSMRNI